MVIICPICDCNAVSILTFLFGLIGGCLISVVAEEGRRRKAMKEQEREDMEENK